MKHGKISPYAILIIGIAAVSTASILIRFAQQSAPSLVIAALRMGFAALILAPFAIGGAGAEIRSITRKQWSLLVLSGLLLCLHFASWISSIGMTSITSSVVLVTTAPLWVALLAPLVLKERLSVSTIVGLVVTLCGGLIVGASNSCTIIHGTLSCNEPTGIGNGTEMAGNILALAGAWFSAGYLLVGRSLRKSLSLLCYTFLVYAFSALGLLVLLLLFKRHIFGFDWIVYVIGIALAVVPQLVGHSSFNWALRYLPASFVSIALLGEPVGTSILAVIILNEKPTGMEILGGIIILLGIYISARSARTD